MRLWLLKSDGSERLYAPLNLERATHEWWSANGDILYYCKYVKRTDGLSGNNAITGINLKTGEHKVYAPVPAWHGFSSLNDEFYVYDENKQFYRGTASSVGFYNAMTGKQVYIVTQNPPLATSDEPSFYHLDPHPQFVLNDRYVSYTIAVAGQPEVALAPTEQLLKLTQ